MSHPVDNTASAPKAHTVDRDRTAEPGHSGDGRLGTNLVAYSIMLLLFLGSVYSLSFFERTNVLPFGISLVLAFLAFWIPQTILGRSDTGPQLAHGERREQ
jgi:hypothetical protein